MDAAKRIRVEFHCHTNQSPDGLITPEALIAACRQRGIDRVAITDHNHIEGALAVKRLAPKLVIVGEEVRTTEGELLAFFVQERVPPGLLPEVAIECLRSQGAFISISHPFDFLRGGAWREETLNRIAPLVDGLEVFNSRCLVSGFNRQARQFAEARDLIGMVGSDAHHAWEVGRATMWLPQFEDAAELRQALQHAQAEVRRSPLWVRLFSRYAWLRRHLT